MNIEKIVNRDAVPDYIVKRVTDLTARDLYEMGVKALGVDLDNTVVYDGTDRLLPGVLPWLDDLRAEGIKVFILSNTNSPRAHRLGRRLRLKSHGSSSKPAITKLIRSAREQGIDITEVAMAGDRLFTDVECANSAGAVSVRTLPFKKEVYFASFTARERRKEEIFISAHRGEFLEPARLKYFKGGSPLAIYEDIENE